MKIRKNDNVIVLAGKDKGKKGKVTKVFPLENKAIVEGVNLVKRHTRAKQRDKKGEIDLQPSAPINLSNLSIVDPKDNKPTRVGFSIVGGKKGRISRRTKQKID